MAALSPFSPTQNLVVKIGSALLVNDAGDLRRDWLMALSDDIAALKASGAHVTIVSSGAIALGRARLGLGKASLSLSHKQACAAAGQTILTQAYQLSFDRLELITAQALLTLNDTEDRRRWLNARSTLDALLGMNVIPIINENDTVATDEIRYGDNDRLAARTAQMIGADTLVLLSDVNGLYTSDPRKDEDANHLPLVEKLTSDIMSMAGGINAEQGVGSGGMITKLKAAQIATQAGCAMCIMDGFAPAPLTRLQNGETCTWFKPVDEPRDARRQWILGGLKPKGTLLIDDGAARALKAGKSLLAAGVKDIQGDFSKGDAVRITAPGGEEIARGLIAYDRVDAQKIMGRKSQEISAVLGYDNGAALIHRDNMAMIAYV